MVALHRRARVQLDGPQETPRPSKGRAPSSYLSNLLTESGLSITTPLGIENRGDLSIVISFFGGVYKCWSSFRHFAGGGDGGWTLLTQPAKSSKGIEGCFILFL